MDIIAIISLVLGFPLGVLIGYEIRKSHELK